MSFPRSLFSLSLLLLILIYPLSTLATLLIADCHHIIAHFPGPAWTPHAFFASGFPSPSTPTTQNLSAPFLPRTHFLHKTCCLKIHYTILAPDYPLFTEVVAMQTWREAKAAATQMVNEAARRQVDMFLSASLRMPGLRRSHFLIQVAQTPEEGLSRFPRCQAAMRAMQGGQPEEVFSVAPMSNIFATVYYTI